MPSVFCPVRNQKESIIYQTGKSPPTYILLIGRVNKWRQEKWCKLPRELITGLVSISHLHEVLRIFFHLSHNIIRKDLGASEIILTINHGQRNIN